jgi:hypothetical protein
MSFSSTATTLTLTLSDAGGDASAVLASLPSQSPSLSVPDQTPPFEIHSSQEEKEEEEGKTPPPVLRRMAAFVATPSPSPASTSSLSLSYADEEDAEKA